MKKVLMLILAIMMVIAVAGCSGNSANTTSSTPATPSASVTPSSTTTTTASASATPSSSTVSQSAAALPLAGKHLKIAVNAENAPMESVDKDGKYVGFSVDLADALAKKLGFTYEWSDMEFFGLISAVQEGRADMILSSISATDERRQKVDFTDGYYTPVTCIISGKDSGIKTIADLNGKKVGGATGTIFEKFAKTIPGVQYKSYDSTVPAIEIIGTSELDAIVESSTYGERYAAGKNLDVNVIPKSVIKGFVPSYAIAVPKGSPNLAPLNKALNELINEGFVQTLFTKYLGQDYVDKLKIYNAS